MGLPAFEADTEPKIRPNLRLVGADDAQDAQQLTSRQLSSAESQPNLSVIDGGGESTPERANLQAVDGIKGAEEANNNPATAVPFDNKVTPKDNGTKGIARLGGFVKRRGAIMAIVAILTGGASIPFLAGMSLPFALVGNMNVQSVVNGANQYMEDYLGFSIFGFKDKTSVAFKNDKMVGLTDAQIKELTDNGVKLSEPTKTKGGKTVFGSIEIDGKVIASADELKSAVRAKPSIISKVLITKPSLWKSFKGAASRSIQARLKTVTNPKIQPGTPEEQNKQILQDSLQGEKPVIDPKAKGDPNDKDTESASKAKKSTEVAKETASEFAQEIEDATKAISEGKPTANPLDMDNVTKLLATEGDSLAVKNVGKIIWSYINPLDIANVVCGIYQIADTANILARGVVVANTIRLATVFISTVQKIQSGDGSMADLEPYMKSLNTPNPSTGDSFDQSPSAQMIFNNEVSNGPMAITALGGAGMLMLTSGLRSINKAVALGGSAKDGRAAIKSMCGIATNLGLQIGVTVGSVALGVLTLGGSTAAEAGAIAGAKAGLEVGKIAIKKMIENILKEVAEKGASVAIKDMTKGMLKKSVTKGWEFLKIGLKNTAKDPWAIAGIALAGVEAFGMPYIIQAVTGGNIANALYNGPMFVEAIKTGKDSFDYQNNIANGAVIGNMSMTQAYLNNEYKTSQQIYIAMMQHAAKDKPFDITNPFSALGTVLGSARNTFGTSAFSSFGSTLTTLAATPTKLPKLFGTNVYAGNSVDLQAVSDAVGDEFYSSNNIAVQISGVPLTIFNKLHTFEQILIALVYGPNPQMTHDGDDPNTGEPKLSIIPGSTLAAYRDKCHNPENTELDDMFSPEDGGDKNFDMSCTLMGRKSNVQLANSSTNPHKTPGGVVLASGTTVSAEQASLYDDAIAFMAQVNPSVEHGADGQATQATGGSVSLVDPSKWAVAKDHNGAIDKNSSDWTKWSTALGGNGNSSTGVLTPIAGVGPNICSQENRLNKNGGGNLFNPNAAASAKALIDAYNKGNPGKYLVPGACFRSISAQELAYSNFLNGGNLAAKPGTSNHGWGLAIDFRIATNATGLGDSITSFKSADYLWMQNNSYQFGWINPRGMQPVGGCTGNRCEPWHFQYVGPLYGDGVSPL